MTSHTAPLTLASAAGAHPGFLSPSGVEIAFLLVGLVTLGAAVITVTTRQLVHAALWLVVALGGLAVEYLLLTAEFIAWVQVLIYVGSIVVLLLFGLMLTRAPVGRSPDADSGNRPVALGVAVAAAAALVWVVTDAFRTTWIELDGPAQGSTEVTGAFLFRNWVLPFEALSVLLLAALVGAIVLSRKRDTDADTGTGAGTKAKATSRKAEATGTKANATGAKAEAPGAKAPGTDTKAEARPAPGDGPAPSRARTPREADAPGQEEQR
ncbi:NADH-quinone oxidoreductase subunit J [Streptomyces sp. AFD10]|uniref:NADH-quinone oxidoreductase subunit J family protein n=1 Tax=Streptomyces sp. AFD10 TaxID=3050948 RepID=UPI0034E04328